MQISSLKLYRSMQCIACVCNFKVRNLIVRCDLKKYHFTMGSCSIPGSTTWWSRQFYWDKIQSNPRSPWYIWWFFRDNLTFWGIFKVQFVLPSSIFVSFTSHRSRGVVVSFPEAAPRSGAHGAKRRGRPKEPRTPGARNRRPALHFRIENLRVGSPSAKVVHFQRFKNLKLTKF